MVDSGAISLGSSMTAVAALVFDVRDYGATGDGATDDTAAIQSAINAAHSAGGGTVLFPTTTSSIYLISAPLVYYPDISYVGGGYGMGFTPIVRQASGANIGAGSTSALFVPNAWYNNTGYADAPARFFNLEIDGNSANNAGSIASNLIIMSYQSIIDQCYFVNSCHDQILITDVMNNGSTISGTGGQNRINNCYFNTAKNDHIEQVCNANNAGLDGYILNCDFNTSTASSIYMAKGSGWIIDGNHMYGVGGQAIDVKNCYGTRITNNYIESFGTTAASGSYYQGINVTVLNGPGVIISNNQISCAEPTGPARFDYINVSNASGNTSTFAIIEGNHLYSTNPTSKGYAFYINPSAAGAVLGAIVGNVYSNIVNSYINSFFTNDTLSTLGAMATATYDPAAIDQQVVGTTAAQTVTNKRITKRVLALSANSATPAVDSDTYDVVHITAQTAAITEFTMTGTPVDGDTIRVSITGTAAVAITWGASFEASTVALPTTTTSTDRLDVSFFWNTETSKWRCVAVA